MAIAALPDALTALEEGRCGATDVVVLLDAIIDCEAVDPELATETAGLRDQLARATRKEPGA